MNKPRFSNIATSTAKYLIPLFTFAHFSLGALVLLSGPVYLITAIAAFLLLFYFFIGITGLTYFLKLIKDALKDFVENGLSKDSREVLVITFVLTSICVLILKILG